MTLEHYYLGFVVLQLLHSQEEIHTGFHKQWPFFRMTKKFFVSFEVIFSIFIILPLFVASFPLRTQWMYFFNLLMFANGIQHLVWAGIEKRYVPGLVTSFGFIFFFIIFYFKFLIS